jgi:hypothetical protein
MKKILFIILLCACVTLANISIGQSQSPKKNNHPSGKQHTMSIGANIPIGNFSSTHSMGAGANYSWSYHRFGGMDVRPVQPFGFTANAGGAYYFGKKEMVSGYSYDYPPFIVFHVWAGAIYNPWRKGNISLTAGPALRIYNGNTQFNIGSKLELNYYFHEKIAITPCLIFMKESGSDPLWAVSLKATMAF